MKLADLITDYINRPREPQGYKQVKRYKPSSFGQCFRRQWYKKNRFKPTNPPDDFIKEIFLQGNMCEDLYVKQHPGAELQYKVEIPGFLGYADLKFEDRIEEVKSVSGAVFRDISNPRYNVWKEKLHNVLQLGYYMVKSNLRGNLVFINRDSLCISGFSVEGSRIVLDISGKIKEYSISIPLDAKLTKAVNEEMGILSVLKECPRAEPRMKNECGMCDYRGMCYKESGVMF